MFTSSDSAGSNTASGHEQMLLGSLRWLFVFTITVMISMSVAAVFHLASQGSGWLQSYVITYYCKYLPFGATFTFILTTTSVTAAAHLLQLE